jgi:hypothetical protein
MATLTLLEFTDRVNAAAEAVRPHARAFGEELAAACQAALDAGLDPGACSAIARRAAKQAHGELDLPMMEAVLRVRGPAALARVMNAESPSPKAVHK